MEPTSILKKASWFEIGLGILSVTLSFVVIALGVVVMNTSVDSPLAKAFAQRGYGNAGDVAAMGVFVCFVGVIAIFISLFNIARGVVGLKAANGSCFTAAMVMGILGVIGDSLGMVLAVANGSAVVVKVLYFVVSVFYIYGVHGSKQEYENAEMSRMAASINNSTPSTDEEAAKFFGN